MTDVLLEVMIMMRVVVVNVIERVDKIVVHVIIVRPTKGTKTKKLTNTESILTLMFTTMLIAIFVSARAM